MTSKKEHHDKHRPHCAQRILGGVLMLVGLAASPSFATNPPEDPSGHSVHELITNVRSHDLARVEQTLALGADPNEPDDRGLSPLFWALHTEAPLPIIKALLVAGADADTALDSRLTEDDRSIRETFSYTMNTYMYVDPHKERINWTYGVLELIIGRDPTPGESRRDAELIEDKPFRSAALPLEGFHYHQEGHIQKDGSTHPGGRLGPGGYVSAVLHQMLMGIDVLRGGDPRYDDQVYQWRGARVAAHFDLELSALLSPEQVRDPAVIRQLVEAGVLQAGGLYLFSVTAPVREIRGNWRTVGHVGFVRVGADGSLTQNHYSGVGAADRGGLGLVTGSFTDWYDRTFFRDWPMELYAIEEK